MLPCFIKQCETKQRRSALWGACLGKSDCFSRINCQRRLRAAPRVARVHPAMTRLPSRRGKVRNQAIRFWDRWMIRWRFVLEISGRIRRTLSSRLKSLQRSLPISSGLAPVKSETHQKGKTVRLSPGQFAASIRPFQPTES
jgi:hypothetical protein